jgi:hypothetical protein
MTQLIRNKLARINAGKYRDTGILKLENKKITDLRSVTPYSLVAGHQLFVGTLCLYLQGKDLEPRKSYIFLAEKHFCSTSNFLRCNNRYQEPMDLKKNYKYLWKTSTGIFKAHFIVRLAFFYAGVKLEIVT